MALLLPLCGKTLLITLNAGVGLVVLTVAVHHGSVPSPRLRWRGWSILHL